MKQLIALAALAAVIVCSDAKHAQAHQGPEDLAAECAQAIRTSVTRVRSALADDVSRCVPLIKRLKEAGNIVEARIVARRCVNSINGTTRTGYSYVRELCERCVNRLLDLGAPDLAERIRGLCADALDDIEQAGNRARNAVTDALNS